MPDLLLELLSEEIPARMQARAAADLKRLVTDALVAAGFLYEGAVSYATPRRLALHVAGLPARGQDTREERRGPRVGVPEAALKGFLRSAGVDSVDQVRVESDPKKGDYYVATVERPGRPTAEVLADIVPATVRAFPWPKSMRWGAASLDPGSLRWVRPLQSILCVFGDDTVGHAVVPFTVDGIASGDTTRGHRFLAPAPFTARHFEEYVAGLAAAKVVLDPERRADAIRHDATNLAFAAGLDLVPDEALLAEVAGLVEWPVVLMGAFDPAFLDIPPEAIRATIRANQKCFVLREGLRSAPPGEGRDPAPGGMEGGGGDGTAPGPNPSRSLREPPGGGERGAPLSNRFLLVSNLAARDGGAAIVAGNERVVRARLADAKFFWDTDRKAPLEDRLERLKTIVFHEKLGTQFERVERIATLARALAPSVAADPALAERAARLCKADLVTEMVGEFPELQGTMGRHYAAAQGEDPRVAAAIADHYRPVGPTDGVPSDPVAVAVALADKLDTLVGFWAIGETPTGSKDPYALRRAALGVIRIVLENGLTLPILSAASGLDGERRADLLAFFHDRLKVYLRDRGARHDLIDAVLAASSTTARHARDEEVGDGSITTDDDLLLVVRRVEALGRFLDTADGRDLLAGTKRAANILRIEEKKDGTAYDGAPDLALIASSGPIEEKRLVVALVRARDGAEAAVAAVDFEGAMRVLAELRPAVDAFFEAVTVNADDPATRANRLRLLATLRAATRTVADFARIEG